MPELGPASLHNLQLSFGPLSSMHGIHFTTELLAQSEGSIPVLGPRVLSRGAAPTELRIGSLSGLRCSADWYIMFGDVLTVS